MLNWARPFVSGIVAALIASGATYLAARGIDISKDTQEQIVLYVVPILLGVFGTVFHSTDKIVAKFVNPGDAATTRLVEEHMHENAQLKAAKSSSPSVIR
jgi:hypothetical protein